MSCATRRPAPRNLVRGYWPDDRAAVLSSSEQESESVEGSNVARDQVHVVLTRDELVLVVSGLRQYGKLPLFERLERILASLPR